MVELDLAGFDHRQLEQLVDELRQVIDLALDLAREVPGRDEVVDRAAASASRRAA